MSVQGFYSYCKNDYYSFTETFKKKDNQWLTVKKCSIWAESSFYCFADQRESFFFLLNLTGFLKSAIHRDWLRKSLLLWTMKMCYKRFVTVQCWVNRFFLSCLKLRITYFTHRVSNIQVWSVSNKHQRF